MFLGRPSKSSSTGVHAWYSYRFSAEISTLIVVLPVAFASLFSLRIAASLYPAEFLCKRKQCSGVAHFRCDLRFFSVSLLFYRFIHVLFCNRLFSDVDDSFQNEYFKTVLEN